jgi:hypothetical protein
MLAYELYNLRVRIEVAARPILGFVRGLYLSTRLIYALREKLSRYSLEVDWGHLLDTDSNYVSRECDIIIHKIGQITKWNGNKEAVMDFRFIRSNDAVAVISCKSLMNSIKSKDVLYCSDLKPLVDNVLLFAECCHPTSVDSLKRKAKEAGYAGFWRLYSYTKKTSRMKIAPEDWEEFILTVDNICKEQIRT